MFNKSKIKSVIKTNFFQISAPFIILFLFAGCKNINGDGSDNDTSDTDYIDTTVNDTQTDQKDTDSSDSDTIPGVGGIDEPCHVVTVDTEINRWCDSTNLIAQECSDNSTGCCCRESCSPQMCPTQKNTPLVSCIHLEKDDNSGICNYSRDLTPMPVSDCTSPCIPVSSCTSASGNETACTDSDYETLASGECFYGEIDSEMVAYCLNTCKLKQCNDTHLCISLASEDGVIDGTGSCIPYP